MLSCTFVRRRLVEHLFPVFLCVLTTRVTTELHPSPIFNFLSNQQGICYRARPGRHQRLLFSSLFIITVLTGCGCEVVFGGGFDLFLIIDGTGHLASAGWCFSLWL